MPDAQRETLKKKFKGMMSALYRQEGAMMEVEILKDEKVLDFIDTHSSILDSTFEKVKMSDTMRSSLQQSNWVFSGMKTFHELKEAFPSLIDENGEKKPFERFYNDVQRVDETYNRNYLRAEYNFVSTSAEMAARWEEFEKDGDRYFLQYRTVGDDRVRQEHAALEGTTLPVEHPFWDTHYPPNGWNCRCNVVQVRKSRYPATSEDELIERKKALAEEQARHKGKSEMFRFNPGKQRKTFPDYNPYTIKRCADCDIAKGKMSMAFMPSNEACEGCAIIRKCFLEKTKTEKGILRTHYEYKLRYLREKTFEKETNHGVINVGLTGKNIEHLVNDVLYGKANKLSEDDLLQIGILFENSTYLTTGEYIKGRTDIAKVLYFHNKEKNVIFNVMQKLEHRKNGKIIVSYFLHAVSSPPKTEESPQGDK